MWMDRFPLPDSFTNPRFKRWAMRLDLTSKRISLADLVEWQVRRLGLSESQIDLASKSASPEERFKVLDRFMQQASPQEKLEYYESLKENLLGPIDPL